jgi:hypothetical protein
VTEIRAVAASYADKGITVCPLGLDARGRPKQRLDRHATRFRPGDNTRHSWENSIVKGIAIVLGPPSGNLAVIDIDDRGLADYLQSWLSSLSEPPLMTCTPRGLHIWVREPHPSQWAHLTAKYQGRECDIDILCAGNVATIPPTPGYRWLRLRGDERGSIPAYGRVLSVWNDISIKAPLGIPYRQGRARRGSNHWSPSPSINQVKEALDVGR